MCNAIVRFQRSQNDCTHKTFKRLSNLQEARQARDILNPCEHDSRIGHERENTLGRTSHSRRLILITKLQELKGMTGAKGGKERRGR